MKISKKILRNGMRLITVPMADNPSVTVLVMVEAGSKYENKKNNGISHFLEHMVFKGTTKRPKASQISRELDSIGSQYNAFTSQEFTGYYAKADYRHFDTVLDVVSDMYLDPIFDKDELQKEKGVIVEEIRMYKDLPQYYVREIFTEVLYGDQPAGWNIAGTEENVKSFSREDFVNYRKEHYVSSATTVVVSGSFPVDVEERIEKTFERLEAGKKSPKLAVKESQKEPVLRVEKRETDQTHLVLGFRTFPIDDKRIPTMNVLSTILGRGMSSRLFSKMRDQLGICYYIKAEHDPYTDHGVLMISAGVDNARVLEGLDGILSECTRLKNEIVPDWELKKAKDYIAGTTMLELETSDSRAEYCGYQEILRNKIETPEDIIRKIQAVTSEEVEKLAKEIFVNSGLNLALLGRSEPEVIKSKLKID